MADRIIPIDFTTTIRAFATYILRNKCDQPATTEQALAYEKELAAKGFVNPLDILVRDNRYWPLLRQYLTKVVVLDDSSLPACSLAPEPKKLIVPPAASSSSVSTEQPLSLPPVTAAPVPTVPPRSSGRNNPRNDIKCPLGQVPKGGRCVGE